MSFLIHLYIKISQFRPTVVVAWTKPDEGFVKNVDAALFEDGRFSVGMCIRNENGHFVKTNTMCFIGSPDQQEAEAWGLLEVVIDYNL